MAVHMSQPTSDDSSESTFVYGVSMFAGVILCVAAISQMLAGIGAIADDAIFVSGVNYTYKLDVTAWGWIHLVLGAVALATGVGIIMEKVWAYVVGIVIACVNTMANFAFIPHYPFWSIVVIAFNILVVWALCVRTSKRGII